MFCEVMAGDNDSQAGEDRQKPGEKGREEGLCHWEVVAGDGGDKQTDEDRQTPGEKRRGDELCFGR